MFKLFSKGQATIFGNSNRCFRSLRTLEISIVISPNPFDHETWSKGNCGAVWGRTTGTCGISGLIAARNQIADIVIWAKQAGFQAVAFEPADEKRAMVFSRSLKNFEPEYSGGTVFGLII